MTTTVDTTTAGVETASEPHSASQAHGRSGSGAAAARTEQLFAEYGRTVSGLCRADLRALWLAIEELPHKQRDALLLREFGGMSYGELAAALAISGSAVESLLFRARDGLRGKLRAIYGAITGASWLEAIVRIG